jgi:hypothetical protein
MVTRSRLMSWLLACIAGATFLGRDVPAHADQLVSEVIVPICDEQIPAPAECTGGVVILNGERRFRMYSREDSNGGIHHSLRVTTDATAEDPVTHTLYIVKGSDTVKGYDGLTAGSAVQDTFIDTLHAISPGPEANFMIHSVQHFTLSASGVSSPGGFNFFSECRG